MSGDQFDPQGEAREALSTAVSSYGMRVLSDPRILGNLVTDLLPDSPRERSLLVTAAEAGMATELSQHVEQQRLSVEAAVALVARGLTERRSIDVAASTWVATEYAHALGYQVRAGIPPAALLDLDDETPLTATVRRPRPSPQAAPFPAAVPPLAPTLGPPAQDQPAPGQPAPVPQQEARPPSPWSPQSSPAVPPPPYPAPSAQPTPSGQPPAYQPTAFSPPPAGFTSQPSAAQPSGQPTSQPQPPQAPSPYPPPSYQPSSQPQSPYQSPSSQPLFPQAAPSGMPPSSYQPAFGQPGSQPIGQPASQPASPYQPAGFPAQPGYSGPVPGSPVPGWGGTVPPRNSRRTLWLAIGGGVGAVGAVVGIVLALSSPAPKHNPPVTQPSVTHTPTPTPTASATPTVANGVTPVVQLLPSDITDTTTECGPQSLPLPFKSPGLVTATKCADPGLTGSEVFAFQTDSNADYQATWQNYNKWLGFDPSSAGTDCPPAGSQPQGITEWKPKSQVHYQRNQVLECGTLGSGSTSQVVYIWTYPAQDAFIVAQGEHATTFSQLDTWWKAEA